MRVLFCGYTHISGVAGKQGRKGNAAMTIALVALAAALCALLAGAAGASAETSGAVAQCRFDESAGQTAIDDGLFALAGRLGLTDGVDDRDPQRIAGVAGGALA